MLRILRPLFNHEKAPAADGLTQAQREALIDLLVLAEFEDHKIAGAEVDFITREVASHPWQSTLTLENFYDASVTRTRSAGVSVDAHDDYFADIVRRLQTPAARKRAYDLCRQLMGVDGQCNEDERKFLLQVWTRLQGA